MTNRMQLAVQSQEGERNKGETPIVHRRRSRLTCCVEREAVQLCRDLYLVHRHHADAVTWPGLMQNSPECIAHGRTNSTLTRTVYRRGCCGILIWKPGGRRTGQDGLGARKISPNPTNHGKSYVVPQFYARCKFSD